MPMSDYYTCRYRYAAALPMCSCPAMCRETIVATCIDIKKDCKNCRYYREEDDMENLQSCPFCGAKAQLKEISGRWTVCCTQNCVGTRLFRDKQRPIDTWNRRVQKSEGKP